MKAIAKTSFYYNSKMYMKNEVMDISLNAFQELLSVGLIINTEKVGETETAKVVEVSPIFGANRETKPLGIIKETKPSTRKTKIEKK